MDTLDSRFGAVQDVAIAHWGDGALVVAGDGDDELTAMALMPNGHLVHLASFEDTQNFGLVWRHLSRIDQRERRGRTRYD